MWSTRKREKNYRLVTREYLNNTADGMHTNVAELMWHFIFIQRYEKKERLLSDTNIAAFLKVHCYIDTRGPTTLYYHDFLCCNLNVCLMYIWENEICLNMHDTNRYYNRAFTYEKIASIMRMYLLTKTVERKTSFGERIYPLSLF